MNSTGQRRAAGVAALVLIVAGIMTLKGFLPALIWAAVFAIGLWPLRGQLARRWPQHQHTLIPFGIVAAVLVVFVVPLMMAIIPVARDAHSAAAWIDQARQHGIAPPPVLEQLPLGDKVARWWQANLGRPEGLAALGSKAAQGGLVRVGRVVAAQAAHRLVLVGFMLLTLFFLMRDGDDLIRQMRIGAHRAFGEAGEDVGQQILRSVRGTVNGLVLVGLAEGVVLGLAYAVAGVPHPALFALLTALLAMIPFGAPIAFIVAAGALLMGGYALAAAVIVTLGFIVSFVADHFFRPALIGGATQMPFLWVLLGILGGVETWGLVGLFVGPAIMATLVLLWGEWVGTRPGPLNVPVKPTKVPNNG